LKWGAMASTGLLWWWNWVEKVNAEKRVEPLLHLLILKQHRNEWRGNDGIGEI